MGSLQTAEEIGGNSLDSKDTVMSNEDISEVKYLELQDNPEYHEYIDKQKIRVIEDRAIATRQAEITWSTAFKAGEDQGYENGSVAGYNKGKQEAIEAHFEGLKTGQKAGRKEVVDFANNFAGIRHNPEWVARVKKWGIE